MTHGNNTFITGPPGLLKRRTGGPAGQDKTMKDMKRSILKKGSSIVKCLGVVMLTAGILAGMSAEAEAVSETAREDQLIAPGVTESTVYVTDSNKKNVRLHILRISKDADVSFKAACKDYYTEGSTAKTRSAAAAGRDADDWGYQKLRDLAKAYESAGDVKGEVIAASSGDYFNKDTGTPLGNLVIEGNVLNSSQTEPFFAVLKDGSRVIRDVNGSTSDVAEAVGGAWYLVRDGKNIMDHTYPDREPRQVIGICEDGTVVIINADGREPASGGLNIYDTAEVALQQGCVNAINLDGGGSASFLTKRPGDEELIYRNVPGDGFERNVTGSLLIVSNNAAEDGAEDLTDQEASAVSMRDKSTDLTEENGIFSYRIDGEPAEGFQTVNGHTYLFDKDGNGLTESVEIGGTVYNFSGGLLTECSDEDAGTIVIGYCGASDDGKNLLYAYQKGDNTLNIGLNPFYGDEDGRMQDWTSSTMATIPWYSLRSDVKCVNIGKGVTRIGNRFMFVFKGEVFDGTETPECMLETLNLPDSLKSIGSLAFYNKPNLKNISLPSELEKIGKSAFAESGKGFIRFTGMEPPEIDEAAIDATEFEVLCVPDTEEWKKYLESDAAKIGIRSKDDEKCEGTVPFLGRMIVFK